MSSTLSRKADAWVKANDAFIASTTARSHELAQSAARLNKENSSNTPAQQSMKSVHLPWQTTLEELQEQVEFMSTARDAPRLERLVGLSENALDAFERIIDQAENVASIKYGPVTTSTVKSAPSPAGEARRKNIVHNNAVHDDDDDEPPTPPRLTSSSAQTATM